MITEEEIWERLHNVMAEVFDDDVELSASTSASDVDGWDSVSNIELMVTLEKEFKIRFNTGEMASLDNVGQLVQRIATRLNS